jgi:hypothetical protein
MSTHYFHSQDSAHVHSLFPFPGLCSCSLTVSIPRTLLMSTHCFHSQDSAHVHSLFPFPSLCSCPLTISIPRTLLMSTHNFHSQDSALVHSLFLFPGLCSCPLTVSIPRTLLMSTRRFPFPGLCYSLLDRFSSPGLCFVCQTSQFAGFCCHFPSDYTSHFLPDSFYALLTAPMQELLACLPDCSSPQSAIKPRNG